jgi:hypothetical protein
MMDTTYTAFMDLATGFQIQICEFLAPALTPQLAGLAPNTADITLDGPTVSVTVTGAYFNATDIVLVDGTQIPSTFVSPTEITASYTLPSAPKTTQFQVQDPTNGLTSAELPFTVTQTLAPVLNSLTPNTGSIASGPTVTVTLLGTNFLSTDVVLVNGVQITSTFTDADHLTATYTLPASPSTVQFQVKDPNSGLTSGQLPFTVTA